MARILVVDDEEPVRAVVTRLLKLHGHKADAAVDGAEAVDRLQEKHNDLMIIDRLMPRMNGVDAVGIMMITGSDAFETMAQCRDHGAYDYVLKPFRFEYLAFSVYSKILLTAL